MVVSRSNAPVRYRTADLVGSRELCHCAGAAINKTIRDVTDRGPIVAAALRLRTVRCLPHITQHTRQFFLYECAHNYKFTVTLNELLMF